MTGLVQTSSETTGSCPIRMSLYIFLIHLIYNICCMCRFLLPLRLVSLLVCCLYKEVYLQIFNCVSFWLHGCCGEWEGWTRKPVNHTSCMTVVTPSDRPKSVHNRCAIKLFGYAFVLSCYPFDISVGTRAFVIGLSQVSSFFLFWKISSGILLFIDMCI